MYLCKGVSLWVSLYTYILTLLHEYTQISITFIHYLYIKVLFMYVTEYCFGNCRYTCLCAHMPNMMYTYIHDVFISNHLCMQKTKLRNFLCTKLRNFLCLHMWPSKHTKMHMCAHIWPSESQSGRLTCFFMFFQFHIFASFCSVLRGCYIHMHVSFICTHAYKLT